MTLTTLHSSRFGRLEVPAEAVIDFPNGLIGLPSTRWALLARSEESAFIWLHSVDDPELAIPVTNPWRFFADYEVELSDGDTERVGAPDAGDVDVWVTVRAAGELAGFSCNLRAPIVIWNGRGHQVINEAPDAPVRAPLFPEAAAPAVA